MTISAYDNWYGYVNRCTDAQVHNVFADETARLEQDLDMKTRLDCHAAVTACRVVAAERHLTLAG
ncbi:unnamed protein product [marine sediment metagenome]|uniref:Uncharacterized protein n=1 Tax=marine sediment metagenome TaxID=412755 RepID=X0UB62_9ZZZZ